MSIAEVVSTEPPRRSWDWKEDAAFVEQLTQDLRRQAVARIGSGVRAISVSSLVQESLVKLLEAKRIRHPEDRRYLYSLAARAMRFVVVDHLRAQQALKRGRGKAVSNLDLLVGVAESNGIDILAIDEGLEELAKRNERQAQIVEMKFFAGCTMPEIAQHLGFGLSTVENDWTEAKKFLIKFLRH